MPASTNCTGLIKIITSRIDPAELAVLCTETFKHFVKFVADVKRGIIAIGGELHADGEELLMEDGSCQDDLWGANFYPANDPGERLEFESFINIRPRLDNNSMEVQDAVTREKIRNLAEKLILSPDQNIALPENGDRNMETGNREPESRD